MTNRARFRQAGAVHGFVGQEDGRRLRVTTSPAAGKSCIPCPCVHPLPPVSDSAPSCLGDHRLVVYNLREVFMPRTDSERNQLHPWQRQGSPVGQATSQRSVLLSWNAISSPGVPFPTPGRQVQSSAAACMPGWRLGGGAPQRLLARVPEGASRPPLCRFPPGASTPQLPVQLHARSWAVGGGLRGEAAGAAAGFCQAGHWQRLLPCKVSGRG